MSRRFAMLGDNPVLRQMGRKCYPKERYTTMRAAEAHLRSLVKREKAKDVARLNAYGPCRYCDGYHVGHNNRA